MLSSHARADFATGLWAGYSAHAAGEGVHYAIESQWLPLTETKNPHGSQVTDHEVVIGDGEMSPGWFVADLLAGDDLQFVR